MRRIVLLFLSFILGFFLLSCGDDDNEEIDSGPTDTDADADSDSDSDSDTDTDTDTDTVTDTGADAGIDTDTNTDTDTDTDTETDIDAGGDTDTETVTNTDGDLLDWVALDGGTYEMGSLDTDTNGLSTERPRHTVNIPTFEMLRTEVTMDQYDACVSKGVCSEAWSGGMCNAGVAGREDHPANCMDWEEARVFCHWAGGRLPSESEWEYAARSRGKDITYPWGDAQVTCDYAIFYDGIYSGCGESHTWPVCSLPAGNSEQGICDLSGNVQEWVEDYWNDDYVGAPDDGSAWLEGPALYRPLRGGAWKDVWGNVRCASRDPKLPEYWKAWVGFRCSRDVD